MNIDMERDLFVTQALLLACLPPRMYHTQRNRSDIAANGSIECRTMQEKFSKYAYLSRPQQAILDNQVNQPTTTTCNQDVHQMQ